ncbi:MULTISPECIES: DUF1501 domain-containing protein [unclassified Schlesneria]|uniref:DUF1501 domain-containing protein n=1 Tax=Schlesneria TaxID=656899 RepID=UPI00359FFEF9
MLHRRDAMLRLGQFGLGAVTLPQLLRADQLRANGSPSAASTPTGKAKSCILIYLWGGPPQQDLWDMKPHSPSAMRSLFKPIQTVTPGIDVCEHMPNFARHTDKLAIVRSLTHDSDNHEPSVYRTLTGRVNNTLVVPRNQRNRLDAPNLGSMVSAFSKPGVLPAAVTIPRPIGHSGVTYSGTHAGWLGAAHDPMEIAAAAGGSTEKPTHTMSLLEDLSNTRLLARQGLVRTIDQVERRYDQLAASRNIDLYRDQAVRMLTSSVAQNAFNLDKEDPALRDKYGRNEWGESMLLARRLVEAGVRLVTISWMTVFANGVVSNVWDNHAGTSMLTEPYCLKSLDPGFAALMDDLSERGLLDETLVAMYGEFGRTPMLNSTQGRDHWGRVQSAILAGGGIRGGQVYGSSDKDAAYPASNPVSPEDMLATIYHSLGINPDAELHDPLGRPHRIVDGNPITALF